MLDCKLFEVGAAGVPGWPSVCGEEEAREASYEYALCGDA